MKNLTLIIAFLFIGINNTSAQETKRTDTDELTGDIKTITGYVIDETGIPIPNTNIRIKESNAPSIKTDENGKFSVFAEKGHTLEFSYIGMISQEIKVKLSCEYFIILKFEEEPFQILSDCNPCEQKRGISVASQYMFHY